MIGPWPNYHILHPGGVGGVGGGGVGSVGATVSPKLADCLLVLAGARDACERSSAFLTLIQCKCTSDAIARPTPAAFCNHVKQHVEHFKCADFAPFRSLIPFLVDSGIA